MRTTTISLALTLAFAMAQPVTAQDNGEEGSPSVIRDTDPAMTCSQISDEAASLSQQMGDTSGGGLLSSVGDVARSGAAMVIPGAGLVMAGADAVTRPDRERREADAAAVRHRWYYLNGLHAGKGCQQQAAATAASPGEADSRGVSVSVGALPAAATPARPN